MLPRRLIAIACAVLLASDARAAEAPADDFADLLATIRPEALSGIEKQLGVDTLADLPLYEVELAVDGTGGAFAGRMILSWRNNSGKAVDALPLILHPNTPAELGAREASALALIDATAEAGPAVELERARPTLVRLRFATPVGPGERARLRLRFTGSLRAIAPSANDPFESAFASMAGGANSVPDYGLVGRGDGLVTLASAIPLIAPRTADGFATAPPSRVGDLPTHDLANFRLRLGLPKGWSAVTNLAAESEPEPTRDGRGVIVRAAGALRRELVVVASSELARSTCEVGGARVISSYLARDAKAGKAALEAACGSLEKLEGMLGRYPYTELDVAESTIVGGAGGVEFSSMVLIAGMLYRPPEQSKSSMAMFQQLLASMGSMLDMNGQGAGKAKKDLFKEMGKALAGVRRFTVAHEVAHQYFAGIVGSDSQRDACVDEPMAQFLAYRIIEELDGKAAAEEALVSNVRTNYVLYRTVGGADGPADRASGGFRSNVEYAALVYGKAPHLYLALRQKLGAARFDRALKEATSAVRFRRISTDQWIGALERAAGGPSSGVRAAARRWLSEAHGDEDLKFDPKGDELFDQMFGKEMSAEIKQSLKAAGLSPTDLLRMLLGGALGDATQAPGEVVDPAELLKAMEGK